MIGRRTAVGLSLLSALVFCAFAVQSASAAKAINTTAVTCVEGGGNKDFKDAHCDEKVAAGTGKFGHVEIAPTKGNPEETTKITFDNTTTAGATSPAVLKGTAFGAGTEITCNTVHGEGGLHNIEHAATKQHTVTGTVTVKYTKCSVQKPLKCTVKEPIEFKSNFEGVEGLGPEKNTMGIEFKPDPEGKVFVSITYLNKGAEKCALNEKSVNVEGTAIATGTPNPKEKHSGATLRFTDEMTTETLTFGGVKAGFDSIGTVKMIEGNPIALTTTT